MKPGWKTTEFWVSVATSVGAVTAASVGVLPEKYAALMVAVSSGAYAVARGLAKKPVA